jgi:transposase
VRISRNIPGKTHRSHPPRTEAIRCDSAPLAPPCGSPLILGDMTSEKADEIDCHDYDKQNREQAEQSGGSRKQQRHETPPSTVYESAG